MDATRLIGMVEGTHLRAMQCHSTPDGDEALSCVGFARRCPDTFGIRIAEAFGRFVPDSIDRDEPPLSHLHTVVSLLLEHGTWS